ncbi:spermatogenesis-associated protein 5-like protein 1 [Mizuhopecten yessoensis]|uniref:Spermatogenesis-associated protein 5-like protein 1 n=1 Tax=Mizuhopecten yessoensis TaxID=6573 RepID=A0A210Q5J1_MIZYE|nr:spermatogenesis-associated protein 5-like protein 1 [Mizuhopecten yessoensis]XP_021366621.1 spermatogenesis-associated protein 5-like protein 1 [Mizuhopecten yessoensis]OWF44006.1 Spermatogenesis-associated protein 5-like protein 1 [Mizuhopecten yessoensis]
MTVKTSNAVVMRGDAPPPTGSPQTCRMSLALMTELGANLVSLVQITDNFQQAICRLRVADSIFGNYIEYHPTVFRSWPESKEISDSKKTLLPVKCKECSSSGDDLNKENWRQPQTCDNNLTSTSQSCCNFELLNTTLADYVEVCVVTSIEHVKKMKNKLKTNSKYLEDICNNLLCNFGIKENFTVDFQVSLLAKLYNISHLIIKHCEGGECEQDTNAFMVGTQTVIRVTDIQSTERYTSGLSSTASPLGGLEEIARELIETVKIPVTLAGCLGKAAVRPVSGVLLRGPPGTGKTSLVRYVASQTGAHLVTINGPEVFGSRPGQTEEVLQKIFERAVLFSEEGLCILFIDEIDSLCPKTRPGEAMSDQNASGLLFNFLDSLHETLSLVVIGATNRPASLDSALRRPGRLDKEIMMNVPSYQQRVSILEVLIDKLSVGSDIDINKLARMTNGYVGADLTSLCHEAVYSAMSEVSSGSDMEERGPIQMKHFLSAAKSITPSTQKGSEGLIDAPPVLWENIGGLEATKLQIRQAIEWPIQHPEAFSRIGLPCPKGVLLYGPPGCCKTTLVRAAATSSGATFLSLSGAQLYSPYVGDSERKVTEIFQRARAGAPSILFLDEIDSIIGKRSDSSSQRSVQERVLSTLLNELDGIGIRMDDQVVGGAKVLEGDVCPDESGQCSRKRNSVRETLDRRNVVVVAATNRRDLLDEALVRPGRMDRILYVPPPDTQARRQILNIYTRHMPVQDVDLDGIAMATENYTGADLENLCREAALKALTVDLRADVVKMEHFESALKIVKPSLTGNMIQKSQPTKPWSFCPKEH